MKRILVFGMTENPGGMESVIMNYYRKIDKEKIQFEFLCNTEAVAYSDEIEALGGVIYHIPARRDGVWAFRRALRYFFDENSGRYSAFWFNTCSLANIDYLVQAKRVSIPKRIIHCHNAANGDSFLRGCLHLLNRRRARCLATDFWTCSEAANAWFYGTGIEQNPNYHLIQNAIAVNEFLPREDVRKEYRHKLRVENKFVLGHIGRFHFQKNQSFLIPIVKELKERGVDVALLLIGQGEDMEAVQTLVKREKLEEQVQFLQVRNDVKELLQAMDVYVFPSLFEGLSIALLEAQAAGLPCVAADTIDPKSKVASEVTFLSLQAPVGEWAEAILAYANQKKKDNMELFSEAGFDILEEAKKMEEIFLR